MSLKTHAQAGAAIAAAILLSTSAHAAATDPTGIWFDQDGRGAVEIKACEDGQGLCGYVVNIKEQRHADRCGLQILGHVTPGGGGWIYSPDRGRKYDVALKRLSDDKLRVVGNAGSSFFSRTFTWSRAPDDIARCGQTTAATPEPKAAAPEAKTVVAEQEARPTAATGTAALLAAPRVVKREPKPEARDDVKVAAITPATAPKAKTAGASSKTTKTAAASASDQGSQEAGTKQKCTYRIPYVGRTVSIPCRN